MKRRRPSSPSGTELFRDIVWGVQHDAFDDELGEALLRAWSAGARDNEVADLIQGRVQPLRVRKAFGELLPFRESQLATGNFALGASAKGKEIRIPFRWINAGILAVGNTGAGKTTAIEWYALQAAPAMRGFWVSDLYKQDLRHLRPLLARIGVSWIVTRPRDLKLNLLQADCDPRNYLPLVTDLLTRVLQLPGRAVSILRAVCSRLYEEFGIWRGQKDEWPTLFDCYERIKATPGLNAPAREALLDRLGALLVQLTPEVAAYRQAWRPSELSGFHIDFEMRGASEQVKTLVVSQLLFSVLYHRLEDGASNRKLDTVIAFEDAQRFFGERSSMTQEVTPIEEIAGLVRGTGVSLWGACQTMHGLSRGLIPNLATRLMGRLGSHEDYRRLGADMGMNGEQIKWAKLHLRPGLFIAQVAEGPWRQPFVLKIPRLTIPARVTDAEAKESVKALDSLRTIPAEEFRRWEPSHLIEISSTTSEQGSRCSLSEAELRFLRAVVTHPGQQSSAYPRLARMSTRKAKEVRGTLVAADYLREHTVATGARGRNSIVIEPTEKGHALIQELDNAAEETEAAS